MSKTTNTSKQLKRTSFADIADRVLIQIDKELDSLPELLQSVSPEKRLDFISKNLSVLLKYQESDIYTGISIGYPWDGLDR